MRRRVCLLLPAFLWATPALYPAGKYPGTRVTLAAGWISEWLPKWGSQAASLLPRPSTVSSLKTSDILPGTEVEKRCQQLIHQSSARFFCVYYPTRAQPDALAPLLGCPPPAGVSESRSQLRQGSFADQQFHGPVQTGLLAERAAEILKRARREAYAHQQQGDDAAHADPLLGFRQRLLGDFHAIEFDEYASLRPHHHHGQHHHQSRQIHCKAQRRPPSRPLRPYQVGCGHDDHCDQQQQDRPVKVLRDGRRRGDAQVG